MEISQQGLDLIKKWEGLKLKAYLCPGDYWTIGYGNRFHPDGSEVKEGETISKYEAEIYLRNTCKKIGDCILDLVEVNLTQNQFDALVSFTFNVGFGSKALNIDGFETSTLLMKLNQGDYIGANWEIPRWNKVNGKVSQGLVNRRKDEQKLFTGVNETRSMIQTLLSVEQGTDIKNLTYQQLIALQHTLREIGHDIVVDGIYGTQTQLAFNNFKDSVWLGQPNIMGDSTVKKLQEALDKDLTESEEPHPDQKVSSGISHHPQIIWTNFNSHVSDYFSVGEVSRFDTRRIVKDDRIKKNVRKLAIELDKVRKDWGKPIGVTSWYRPPDVNRAVGGVSNSQHLNGGAVDIYPIGGNIWDFQRWVDEHWYGALGYGAKRKFVHLDIRNSKGWKSGGVKGVRWNY